ncbi:MAG: hypothetical protein CGU28_13720 [Candidatus Dactylopiibacterium carminicum]|uniref:Uncharacterized protein n=1 Tax=Candidatus Dactylopiibacterium carminicum TaxID=857335 RepID=A0A272EP05_9RHOO|nr:hypothetical protein [Candidatus Dactylopiibacterium carminicum]KAF7598203.1 hypothetical protein BGI27_14645 [Candidatus Dactylopiibacterium carminicum]PAS91855.1 MAG: hypothetical protein CGU29_14260 [Candidatus Dactylopiibacterium carminicum]PAS94626.1 MAG: hypothetical protein CGU28_13720 [Candidatus Dactylopiibacterium carminicum]PAS96922.1 MAG: hypothetical protein BSR46_14685 [Candidatus Dactylopiibacterium carminicum]
MLNEHERQAKEAAEATLDELAFVRSEFPKTFRCFFKVHDPRSFPLRINKTSAGADEESFLLELPEATVRLAAAFRARNSDLSFIKDAAIICLRGCLIRFCGVVRLHRFGGYFFWAGAAESAD